MAAPLTTALAGSAGTITLAKVLPLALSRCRGCLSLQHGRRKASEEKKRGSNQ